MSGFVFVTPVLPWPADQGARTFQLEAARALLEIGPVTWITRTVGPQDDALRRLRDEGFELDVDRSFESRSPLSRVVRRLRLEVAARRRDEPREIHFVSSPGVRARVADHARRRPDAWFIGAYWSTVRALEGVPVGRRVLLAADVESEAAVRGRSLGTRGIGTRDAARLRRAELAAFRAVDHLLCLTAEDEAAAASLLDGEAGGSRPSIARWPARLSMPEPCDAPRRAAGAPLVLLAYGHWEAGFNRDGLEWFLREIWPGLRAVRPDVVLRLVGRGLERMDTRGDGVEVVGYVEDLRTELESSHVVVIPLRFAGGLRYRLIEALAHGRPVVCTPVAAAGAQAVEGITHLEATDVPQWVRALQQLDDTAFVDSMIRRGRDWAVGTYGVEASRERLARLFERLGVIPEARP